MGFNDRKLNVSCSESSGLNYREETVHFSCEKARTRHCSLGHFLAVLLI